MIYNFGSTTSSQGQFSSSIQPVEERLSTKYKTSFYKSIQNSPLEFTMVFGADQETIANQTPLNRYDLNMIANWLNIDGYGWLRIEQDDLDQVRYRCRISDLKILDAGKMPWALQATVITDSPFAYHLPEIKQEIVTTSKTFSIFSRADNLGYYFPTIEINLPSGVTTISIKNTTDNNREFKITSMPNSTGMVVTIDNENQVITSSTGVNVYQYFNYNFFRLLKGNNSIIVTASSATVKFTSEYPVNVGV
jgi:hypothetical protein